ncbi:hypothetical protein RBXJA2T_06265 [Rubrivivax benzoatilyticus JA2 = ATCC BAA-35]|nr:hypothetical protein RBXJA2T_06265 [Rubrivivax benzoatilyticus JA2 = ATCC BAA-35]
MRAPRQATRQTLSRPIGVRSMAHRAAHRGQVSGDLTPDFARET